MHHTMAVNSQRHFELFVFPNNVAYRKGVRETHAGAQRGPVVSKRLKERLLSTVLSGKSPKLHPAINSVAETNK